MMAKMMTMVIFLMIIKTGTIMAMIMMGPMEEGGVTKNDDYFDWNE